jgi:hypothetical protein
LKKFFTGVKLLDFEKFDTRPIWKKLEYFNFSFEPDSEFFQCLKEHFDYMFQIYITFNFVESKQSDITSNIISGKFDNFPTSQACKKLKEKFD